jgi:flagellar basal-body rod protein FlgF
VENTLLVGLSRQVTLERQLGVIANNIANINTSGFKADSSLFQEYLQSPAHEDNFALPDRRVSFVTDRATWRDMAQGPTQQTGNPLDIAIDGPGFLAVQTPNGERYTRNGAMQINAQGQLVTTDGKPVLGANGPIVLQKNDTDLTIAADGTVTVREGASSSIDAIRGKIRIVDFDRPQRLQKDGANLFSAPDGMAANTVTRPNLVQGAIEKSNVSGVLEMSRMIEVTRTYTNISTLLQQQGDLRKTAIERLAEVPA